MFDPAPLYWYKDKWNQKIYTAGVETSLTKISKKKRETRTTSSCLPDQLVDLSVENDSLLYWSPVLKIWKGEHRLPSADVIGFRIWVRSSSEEELTAFVEGQQCEDSEKGYRLFACKNFEVGDPILFFSVFEEHTGHNALGGNYVRASSYAEESNVHVTINRMLRCTKPIRTGQEIVRWQQQKKTVECFERMDRFVFCPEKGLAGRIGQESGVDTATIHYCDGTKEQVQTKSTEIGFGYRMQRRQSKNG